MLIKVTDPTILAQYPHLAPPKLRVVDMIPTKAGGETVYARDPGTPELGTGRLVQCDICSTYLRSGEPHTATEPTPHTAFDMVVVEEPEIAE